MKKLLPLLLLWCAMSVHGQKVALVLSGGGAKGVAHIGVLKALEESGVPIDFVAGTSMGAIIGGMYVAGFSPDSIEKIVESEAFERWVSGKINPQYVYYFKNAHPDASWLSFRFRLDSIFQTQLPTNLISPVGIDFALMDFFAQASAVSSGNFDSLMLPFRCVASDVRAGKPYVMHSGDVAKSIRASMTFPFYFKPVRIDDKLLFDGGMYNNFPADVALRDFNPDIIIGSKAAGNYLPPKEDDVLSHITNMLMAETNYDVLCGSSVLIQPTLKTVNVIDFSHTRQFIDSGYVATLRMVPSIRGFVTDTVTKTMHDSIRKVFNAKKPPLRICEVQINGLQSSQAQYCEDVILGKKRRLVQTHETHADYSLDQVKQGYFRLLDENRLKSTFPTLVYDPLRQKFVFVVDARYENNLIADFGGIISSSSTNDIFLQVQYNRWRRMDLSVKLNGYMGKFYNSAQAGFSIESPGLLPFNWQTEYTYNEFNYFSTNSYFFTDQAPVFLEKDESYFRSCLNFPVHARARIEAGCVLGQTLDHYFNVNSYTSNDRLDHTHFSFFSPYLEYEKSTLNRKLYADKGECFFAGISLVSGTELHEPGTTSVFLSDKTQFHRFMIGRLRYENYFSTGHLLTPGVFAAAEMTTIDHFRTFTSSSLTMPEFAPLAEMRTEYQSIFRSKGWLALGERNVLSFKKKWSFRLEGYLMVPYRELNNVNNMVDLYDKPFQKLYGVLSASIMFDTYLGPLRLTLDSYSTDFKPKLMLNLGYQLFNRSPF